MKTKLILLCFIVLSVVSCKKEGPAGPQGAQGPQGPGGSDYLYPQGGFIKGTINGMRSDGTPFTLNFDNRYYYEPDYYTFNTFSSSYDFQTFKYPAANPIVIGFVLLEFRLTSLSSTTPLNTFFDGLFYQDIGNNETFVLDLYGISSFDIIMTNFSYNSSTRLAKGNFAINSFNNSTGNNATITGEFETSPVTKYVYRKG